MRAVCLSLLACDLIRPSLVVAASLKTVGGAHPFAVPNRTLSHDERTFAPTGGHVCDRVSSRACS